MSETAPKVIEFAGKFLAKIGDDIVTFDDRKKAETAVVLEEKSVEINARAAAYCEANGLVEKNAAAKTRIISDFLAWEMIPAEADPE